MDIKYLLETKIKHLEPKLLEQLIIQYCDDKRSSKVIIKEIRIDLGISALPPGTSYTSYKYFLVRGWGDLSVQKVKELGCNRSYKNSPFKIDYWIAKGYSPEQANFEVRSRRPIHPEYWIKRGHSEDDAIICVKQYQIDQSRKSNSKHYNGRMPTQTKYWLSRINPLTGVNYTNDEALLAVKLRQDCLSYKRYVKIYGYPLGIEKKINDVVDERVKDILSIAMESNDTFEEFEKEYNKLRKQRRGHASLESLTVLSPLYYALHETHDIKIGAFGLTELKIYYQENEKQKFFRYDFCIDNKIIIEYDGIFYHSNETHRATDDLKTKIAIENGYNVIRISGDLIYKDKCLQLLISLCTFQIKVDKIPLRFQRFHKIAKEFNDN